VVDRVLERLERGLGRVLLVWVRGWLLALSFLPGPIATIAASTLVSTLASSSSWPRSMMFEWTLKSVV
jgi:hypothetical protein